MIDNLTVFFAPSEHTEIDAVAGSTSSRHKAQRQAQQSQANGSGDVQVKSLVKHVLSRELQLYFDRLTAAATDVDGTMREAALASLRSDTGLGGLVPYLVQWTGERVTEAAERADGIAPEEASESIGMMLQVILHMIQNPTLFVEPYVRLNCSFPFDMVLKCLAYMCCLFSSFSSTNSCPPFSLPSSLNL